VLLTTTTESEEYGFEEYGSEENGSEYYEE